MCDGEKASVWQPKGWLWEGADKLLLLRVYIFHFSVVHITAEIS